MTKKPSDVLARMKATATREKPVSTSAVDRPEEIADPARLPAPALPRPARSKRVRFTLDLEPEQHKSLKRFALEADADASEVMRALLMLLQNDTQVRNAVLTALSNSAR